MVGKGALKQNGNNASGRSKKEELIVQESKSVVVRKAKIGVLKRERKGIWCKNRDVVPGMESSMEKRYRIVNKRKQREQQKKSGQNTGHDEGSDGRSIRGRSVENHKSEVEKSERQEGRSRGYQKFSSLTN